jgi:tripartite-type tricarboxylate transporter receptor subunit TctC
MQETSMRTAQITRGPEGRRSAFRFVTALLAIGALGAPLSGAQELPKTPIKIITPYAAASSGDIISRVVAERLSQILGQPVIVDLKPGASGILGALAAADAIPDGTTIVQLNDATTSLNPALYENLKYDTTRDFAPLTYAGRIPMVLVVNSRLEVKDVAGLVAMSRDSKRALDFGTGGLGSIQHVLMELFMKANGLAMTHVPYKGISPAVTAAVTGEVSTVIASVAATLPHIKAGRLKPLAVTGPVRSLDLPDVPTLTELGVAGFPAEPWIGFFAPVKTPPAALERLRTALRQSLDTPSVRERLKSIIEVKTSSPDELTQIVERDKVKYEKLVKEVGIKAVN